MSDEGEARDSAETMTSEEAKTLIIETVQALQRVTMAAVPFLVAHHVSLGRGMIAVAVRSEERAELMNAIAAILTDGLAAEDDELRALGALVITLIRDEPASEPVSTARPANVDPPGRGNPN